MEVGLIRETLAFSRIASHEPGLMYSAACGDVDPELGRIGALSGALDRTIGQAFPVSELSGPEMTA